MTTLSIKNSPVFEYTPELRSVNLIGENGFSVKGNHVLLSIGDIFISFPLLPECRYDSTERKIEIPLSINNYPVYLARTQHKGFDQRGEILLNHCVIVPEKTRDSFMIST
jgi:hypothetical protein